MASLIHYINPLVQVHEKVTGYTYAIGIVLGFKVGLPPM